MRERTVTAPTRRLGITAGLVLGLLLLSRAATWARQPPARPPTRPAVVAPSETQNASHPARARLDLARKVLELIQRSREAGRLGGKEELDKVYLWSRRAVEAQKDIGGKKAELIAAIEDHLARMKKYEALAKRLLETGEVDTLEVLEAQYRLMEAESWLAEAKANK